MMMNEIEERQKNKRQEVLFIFQYFLRLTAEWNEVLIIFIACIMSSQKC